MYRFTSPAVARHPWKLNADGSTVVPEMLLNVGKTSAMRMLLAFLLLPTCALGANSVVNMSHYDLMRPDFGGMAREGVAGVIHEATFPRLERDARYAERQAAALEAGLLWELTTLATRLTPSDRLIISCILLRWPGRAIRRNRDRLCCSSWISKKMVIIEEAA